MTNFAQLIGVLVRGNVDYVIVGGLAATIHGSARVTQDVDIVYARSPENLQRLVDALAPFNPYLRGAPRGLPFDWSAETLQRGLNFTLTTDLGDIDLLGELTGSATFESLQESTDIVELFRQECRVIGLTELIRVKRAAGRPKDLEAVAELEAILEEQDTSDQ